MKKTIIICVLFGLTIFLSVVGTLYLTDSSGVPADFEVHHIDSQVLSEKRRIIVKKPKGYDQRSEQTYPVIYICGGNSLTYSVGYDTELLTRLGHLEPAIIVGIPNINQASRQRDLTPPFMKQDLDIDNSPLGQANRYLKFIEEEVITLVEKRYRNSSKKIIVGHSREGLFVTYTLMSKPDLFQGHLALSPALWREDHLIVKRFQEQLSNIDRIPSRFYISMGDQEVPKMTKAFDHLADILKHNSTIHKIRHKCTYTAGANHQTNPYLSAPEGLEWLLSIQ